jgi:hypothetical protein
MLRPYATTFSIPLPGKTYSLYGGGGSTTPYYDLVAGLVEAALRECSDERALLEKIRQAGRRRFLRQKSLSGLFPSIFSDGNPLTVYTPGVRQHLRSLSPLTLITDRRLWTSERQYHL